MQRFAFEEVPQVREEFRGISIFGYDTGDKVAIAEKWLSNKWESKAVERRIDETEFLSEFFS
jgi:hypothetical protein